MNLLLKTFPQSPDPGKFTGELFQTRKEEITPVLLKLFSKYRKGGYSSQPIL